MKLLALSEAESKRRKVVEFLRRVGNDGAATECEAMSPEEYAAHKGVEIIQNPERRTVTMARRRTKSKDELEAERGEANDYIEELEAKLDDIAGIVTDEEEDGDEAESESDDDEDDD